MAVQVAQNFPQIFLKSFFFIIFFAKMAKFFVRGVTKGQKENMIVGIFDSHSKTSKWSNNFRRKMTRKQKQKFQKFCRMADFSIAKMAVKTSKNLSFMAYPSIISLLACFNRTKLDKLKNFKPVFFLDTRKTFRLL